MEIKKASFYTEEEMRQRFQVPFVLGIPTLRSPAEVRKRGRWAILEWVSGSVLVVLVLFAQLYACRKG
jgi:hypothetical protein